MLPANLSRTLGGLLRRLDTTLVEDLVEEVRFAAACLVVEGELAGALRLRELLPEAPEPPAPWQGPAAFWTAVDAARGVAGLEEAARLHEIAWRRQLTSGDRARDRYDRALALCRPGDDGEPPPTDADGVHALRGLLEADAIGDHTTVAYAKVMVADRAARVGKPDVAADYLAWWYERRDSHPFVPLGFRALARLIVVDRVLAPRGKGPGAKAAELTDALGARLAAPPSPRNTHAVYAEHGLVFIEPQASRSEVVYFQHPRDSEQGFSLHGDQVALALPDGDGDADVTIEVGVASGERGPALRFPFVVTGDLFVRSVTDHRDLRRVSVPPGSYEAVVRFGPRDAEDRTAIRVTLVPRA